VSVRKRRTAGTARGSSSTDPTTGATDTSSEDDLGETRTRPGAARQVGAFLIEAALAIVVALVLTALLRVFVFQVFEVPSGSMEHTLEEQDRIVAVRVEGFSRGDVVVFEDPPSGWMGKQPEATNPVRRAMENLYLLPDSTQAYLVKRVIGMPGDRVTCCDQQGRVTVNGVALDEESYLYTDASGQTVEPSATTFDVIVPADHLFVMGDHRDRSGDSRIHLCEQTSSGVPAGMNGFVPIENVVGPAKAIVLPLNRMTAFSTPATFAAIPAAAQSPPADPVLGAGTCQQG